MLLYYLRTRKLREEKVQKTRKFPQDPRTRSNLLKNSKLPIQEQQNPKKIHKNRQLSDHHRQLLLQKRAGKNEKNDVYDRLTK